jgi:hypothetical protein
MIGSLVRASRSALRHLRRGGERDARIFVGDDGSRGLARGDAGSCPGRDLAVQSRDGELQFRRQLDAGDGADRHRVLRRN